MEICQFFGWNLSMFTFYDFLEEFLSLGILTQDDKILTTQNQKNPQSPICITPEPTESQILKFNQNTPSKRSVANSHKSSFISSSILEVSSIAPTARNHLIKSLHRLCLHVSHFIASEYITDVTMQKEIAYLVITLARKCLNIKNYKSDLLKELYKVSIKDEITFIKNLSELEADFSEIFRYFTINFNKFDDGLGSEKEAFGPFGPFDITEREYDIEGNSVEPQEEYELKMERKEQERILCGRGGKRVRKGSVFMEKKKENLIKALVKVEYSEQKFSENKARRNSGRIGSRGEISFVERRASNPRSNIRRSEKNDPLRSSNKISVHLSNKFSRSEKGSFHSYQNEDFLNMSVFSKSSKQGKKERQNSFNGHDMLQNVTKIERPDIPRPDKSNLGKEKKKETIDNKIFFKTQNQENLKIPKIIKPSGNLISKSYDNMPLAPNIQIPIPIENLTQEKKKKKNKWKKKKLTTTPVGEEPILNKNNENLVNAYMSLPLTAQLKNVTIPDNEQQPQENKDTTQNLDILSRENDVLRASKYISLKNVKPETKETIDNSEKQSTQIAAGESEDAKENNSKTISYNLASSIDAPITKIEETNIQWKSSYVKDESMKNSGYKKTQMKSSYTYKKTEEVLRIDSRPQTNEKNTIKNSENSTIVGSAKKKINFNEKVNFENIEQKKSQTQTNYNFEKRRGSEDVYVLKKFSQPEARPPKNSHISSLGFQNNNPPSVIADPPQRSVKNSVQYSQLSRNPLFTQTRLNRIDRTSNDRSQSQNQILRGSNHRVNRSSSNAPSVYSTVISGVQNQIKSQRPPGLPVYSSKKSIPHKFEKIPKQAPYHKRTNSTKKIPKEPHLSNNLARSSKKKPRGRTINPGSLRYYPKDESFSLKNIRNLRKGKLSDKKPRGNSSLRNVVGRERRNATKNPMNVTMNYSSANVGQYQSEKGIRNGSVNRTKLNLNELVKPNLPLNVIKSSRDKMTGDIFKDSFFNSKLKKPNEWFDNSRNMNINRVKKDSNTTMNQTFSNNSNFSLLFSKNTNNGNMQNDLNKQPPKSNYASNTSTFHQYHQPSPLDFNKFIKKTRGFNSSSRIDTMNQTGDTSAFHKFTQDLVKKQEKREDSQKINNLRMSKSIDYKFDIGDRFKPLSKLKSLKANNDLDRKPMTSFQAQNEMKNSRTYTQKLEKSPSGKLNNRLRGSYSNRNNNLRGSYNRINNIITQVSNNGKTLRGSYMRNLGDVNISKNLQNFKNQQNLQIQAIKQNAGNIRIEGVVENNLGSSRGNMRRVQLSNNLKKFESSRENLLRRSNNTLLSNNMNSKYKMNHLIKGFYQQENTQNISKSPPKFHQNLNQTINSNYGNRTNQTLNKVHSDHGYKPKKVKDIDKIYQQLKQKQKYSDALKKAKNSSEIALQRVMENKGDMKKNFDKFWVKKKGYMSRAPGNSNRTGNGFFMDVSNRRLNTDGNTRTFVHSNRLRRSRDGFQ